MPETTDVSSPFTLTPEGTYKFTVESVPLKRPTKKGMGVYFEFNFFYITEEGDREKHKELLMPWQLGPFLEAFGYQQTTKDKYTWEREEVVNKTIEATIIHEPDYKDKTKTRAKMVDIKKSEIPF